MFLKGMNDEELWAFGIPFAATVIFTSWIIFSYGSKAYIKSSYYKESFSAISHCIEATKDIKTCKSEIH